jgi:hypothetical protein
MLRKIFATALAMATLNSAFSQDSTKTSSLAINGSADLYYKYDFGKSKSNNLTSFTNSHNSFELGMASVKFDYKINKVEMVADLGFGKRAQEFSYNDQGILAAVKQLYLSYTANSWLKLTAGSWATHVGYELVDAYANRNYSMAYMFTNGPFFHTGVKADITKGKSGFMIGLANQTDYKYVPEGYMKKKFVLAQYSFAASDLFKAYVNYVGGQNFDTSKYKQVDLVLTSKVSPEWSFAFNGTVANSKAYAAGKFDDTYKSWYGAALYANYDPTAKFGLTLRSEYFSDKNGLKYGHLASDCSMFATTLSAQIKADNLTLIPEFRVDAANKEIFTKGDGSATKSAGNFLIAAVYAF